MAKIRKFRIDKIEDAPGDFHWEVYALIGPWPFGSWVYQCSREKEESAIAFVKARAAYPVVRERMHFHADGRRDSEDFAW